MIATTRIRNWTAAAALAMMAGTWVGAQTLGQKEDFTATAIANNNVATGAGTVLIHVDRWSTAAERKALTDALLKKGSNELLDKLMDQRPVGYIRTPDSIGYDLRYASQTPGEDGGRNIVLATDRPIGFWEATSASRTLDYPFVVIQMQFDREGKGKGTLTPLTKIRVKDGTIELENFATMPVMLTDVKAKIDRD